METKKHLAVISGDAVHDITIHPGTTVTDIRQQLQLPEEFLISGRGGLPFGNSEDVYGQTRDGEKLYASAPAVVGIDPCVSNLEWMSCRF